MYRREGGRQDPSVCICVTTVSGPSLGCWGGRCWLVFFVEAGKAAEGAKKRRRRRRWWVALGASRRGRRKSTDSRAFLGRDLPPQLPVAANVVATREKKEENGLDSGHLEALTRQTKVFRSRDVVCIAFYYSGRLQILGCKAAAGLGVVEAEGKGASSRDWTRGTKGPFVPRLGFTGHC